MIKFRLNIFNSHRHFYMQVIKEDYDNFISSTILSTSTLRLKIKNNNLKSVEKVVENFLKLLKDNKIEKLYFKRIIKKKYKQLYRGKVSYAIQILRKNAIEI